MKVVIFAGGVGTRLWPVSRKNTPKQFEKLIGDKSTLQQTIDRLQPDFKYSDIYIATGKRYEEILRKQLPEIPSENFILEPDMRDVGPAIGLATFIISKKFPNEPVGILWSDHMVKQVDTFKYSLRLAESMINEKKCNFVFIAQKPRFANQNMGWIEVGEPVEKDVEGHQVQLFQFKQLRYRPKLEEAVSFFEDKTFVWNLGYFVTIPKYLVGLYQQYAPEMYDKLAYLREKWGTDSFDDALTEIYPKFEKISFDDLILVKLKPDHIFVISADLGWSDIGAWESLKEALSDTTDENVTKGKVMLEDSRDALAFNYTEQLVVGIDLEEMLVINTGDVVLVCPKSSVPKIKKLVEKFAGTPNERLT